jgi:hypothetical protein
MFRSVTVTLAFLLAGGAALADDSADAGKGQKQQQNAKADTDVKMSGMSVLGNEEAPNSLVIVPWKSSQLGDAPGLSKLLDDSTQPIDKDVFMRELAYYQIRSTSN